MSFSLPFWILILFVVVPSYIFIFISRIMKLPFKISYKKNFGISLLATGFLLPIIPYILTFCYFEKSFTKPLLLLGETNLLALFSNEIKVKTWFNLMLTFYIFCLGFAILLGIIVYCIFKNEELKKYWQQLSKNNNGLSKNILIIIKKLLKNTFESLEVWDTSYFNETKYSGQIVELDIAEPKGKFVYSGILDSVEMDKDVLFKGGTIAINNVLKIPIDRADQSLKDILTSSKFKDTRSFLEHMVFNINQVSNINIRVKPEKLNITNKSIVLGKIKHKT